eukprot:6071926-Pyramimonas_sp.AAC.1
MIATATVSASEACLHPIGTQLLKSAIWAIQQPADAVSDGRLLLGQIVSHQGKRMRLADGL